MDTVIVAMCLHCEVTLECCSNSSAVSSVGLDSWGYSSRFMVDCNDIHMTTVMILVPYSGLILWPHPQASQLFRRLCFT